VEKNARVLPVLMAENWKYSEPEPHVCCWLVPLRGAFVASVWARPEPMPLVIPNAPRDTTFPSPTELDVDETLIRNNYDYLWIYNPRNQRINLPASWTEICSSGSTSLWKVR
jgi:hypothetical protein